MTWTIRRNALRLAAFCVIGAALSGCNIMSRLSDVGDGPVERVFVPRHVLPVQASRFLRDHSEGVGSRH